MENVMIKSKQELFEAIDAAGLPASLKKVWSGDVTDSLKYELQNPSSLFEAFLSYPEGFPSADELLILWQTNGDSITGYLRNSGVFIRNYLEDGPEVVQVLGSTFQQMISELISKYISCEYDKEELKEITEFLEFQYLDELEEFVKTNPAWEENTAAFIAELEK